MEQVIIYTNIDGILHIVHPAPNVYVPLNEGEPLPDSFITLTLSQGIDSESLGYRLATIDEIARKDVPNGISYRIISTENLNQDPYFRGAWQDSEGTIGVDMNRALVIHTDNLRIMRAPELQNLDVMWSRALARGDSAGAQAAELRRQALRDVTKCSDIAAATTPDELKQAALSIIQGI